MNKYYEQIKDEIFNYRRNPDEIINPVRMATDHGIIAAYSDFSKNEILGNLLGYYKIVVEGGKYKHIICYKQDIDKKWLGFILAHELGHYFLWQAFNQEQLQSTKIVDAFFDNQQSLEGEAKEKEEACDLFAREMLMPDEKFRKGIWYYREMGYDDNESVVFMLADDFNVPFKEAKKRMEEVW